MKAVALPVIDPARCTGCGWCVAVCPPHVLSLQVLGTAAGGQSGRCWTMHRAAQAVRCVRCAAL